MKFSVIIPAYEAEATLPILLDSLSTQSCQDFEVIVVDDCSRDHTADVARSYDCGIVRLIENHGPAYCRNVGAKRAGAEVLVFTDSDCCVDHHWLENIRKHFLQKDTEAIMGRLVLRPSTFLGDSISALGFPAGGAVGFDKIWKVDEKGFTDSLSSCNCAVNKDIFRKVGGFDESFPYPGGEDSLLAYNLRRLNYRIRYCPDVLVYHEARDSFRDFLKWQFRRGESSFIFSTKVSGRRRFLSLRIWSTANILRHSCRDKKFPMVLSLLGMSLFLQSIGFLFAKHKRESHASSDH